MQRRFEYAPLKGDLLTGAVDIASGYVDTLFQASYADGEATFSTESTPDVFQREAVINYVSFEAPGGDRLFYDETDDTLVTSEVLGTFCETRVELRHELYASGPLREVASLRFERTLPYTDGAFIATYLFEMFAGGSV